MESNDLAFTFKGGLYTKPGLGHGPGHGPPYGLPYGPPYGPPKILQFLKNIARSGKFSQNLVKCRRPNGKAGLCFGLDFGLDSGLDFGLTIIDL